MKHYILAVQSPVICTDEKKFEFVFRDIIWHALKSGSPEIYKDGSCFFAEFEGRLTASVDTADDFREISSFYRKEYDRNANLRIKLNVTDEAALPYICSHMALVSCDDITLTDENGLVISIHNYSAEYGDIPEKLRNALKSCFDTVGILIESVFREFDLELNVSAAIEYAEEHFEDLLKTRETPAKTVYTTYAYDLGIACPSLVTHRVIGGNKRGRILKRTPEKGDDYCIIGYDENNKPLFFTFVNSFDRRETEFFFDFDGFTWAMELYESDDPDDDDNGKHIYGEMYKYRYDDKGRIEYFASIECRSSIRCEKYEYPKDGDIICHYYHYIPGLNGSSRNIPAGYEHSPMYESLYEISPDLKCIKEYDKKGEEYVFTREIKAAAKKSKTPKPAEGSYEKFTEWLDGVLSGDIPESGGVYFDLMEPFEDGFSFAFQICEGFDEDDDDWACYPVYSTDQFMISTDGQIEWDKALKHTAAYIRKYLREGEKRKVLKKYQGIGAGLSDSDITYI